MKTIFGHRLSTPDVLGFPDLVQITEDNKVLFESKLYRTNPNPFQPKTMEKWNMVYTQIATNTIPFRCDYTNKHGKCIILNPVLNADKKTYSGGPVMTTAPDPNNAGKMFALAVLIHASFSASWPGSMACQTIQIGEQWNGFINQFKIGENGLYILTNG